MNAICQDYKAKGRCDFVMPKQKFLAIAMGGITLVKNGPYNTDEIKIEYTSWLINFL